MTSPTWQKMKHEIHSFFALSIVNVTFSAITLAMGIVLSINNLFRILESNSIFSIQLIYVIIGCILAGIGFWWILTSTYLMDFITDIQYQYYKKKGKLSEDEVTGIIIKMISYYREKNQNIKRMIFICRVGGVFFIINGIVSTIDLSYKIHLVNVGAQHMMQISAIFIMFIWGIVSLFIPRYIRKYALIWDTRLKQSEEAEKLIIKKLESS